MNNLNVKPSSILHSSGRKMVMLGGDVYDQRKTGDIISEFKWVDGEPVMLIYKNTLGNNSPAFMIEFADGYKYATSQGNPTKELLQTLCHECAKAIGVENDKASIFRLIGIITDGLPDLMMMPPEPTHLEIANRPSTGNDELKIMVDGQTIIETVV